MALKNGSLYKHLYENMHSGFAHCQAIYDDSGNLVDWLHLEVNHAFATQTGIKDAKGKLISDMYPDPRTSNPLLFESCERVVKGFSKFEMFENYSKPLDAWFDVYVYSAEAEDVDTFTITFENITERKQHSLELEKANIEVLMAFVRTLKFRDKETDQHSERVTSLFIKLATLFGGIDLDCSYRGALLHDIGKMFVPDTILQKPGKLTDGEIVIMKQHPQNAYDLLSPIRYLSKCLDIPYCHHEKWDGSGYPRGLKGEKIPVSARLFSIVDVYDALTSRRPYREPMSHKFALNYIEEESGKSFDPRMVAFFIRESSDGN